jgi:hypothetical protein
MVLDVVASDGTSSTIFHLIMPPAPGVVGSVTKLVVPFMRLGLADPPVADVGFQLDVGPADVVDTRLSMGLLELPAVPAKIALAVVTIESTAGYVWAESYASHLGADDNAVEYVSLKTLAAVLLLPYPTALFGIAIYHSVGCGLMIGICNHDRNTMVGAYMS